MKRLREAPTSSGRPNDLSSASRAMAVMLCSGVLPKPMPGSSTIVVARDAGACRDVERTGEERRDVGHDVDRGIGGLAVVHDDDRHAVVGDHARHVGVALQAPDVVDDGRAGAERPAGHFGLHGVDRYRHAERHGRRQHRARAGAAPPPATPAARRRRGGSIPRRYRECRRRPRPAGWACSIATCGLEELPAVGKGVGRDVEHAHHDRAPARQKPGKRILRSVAVHGGNGLPAEAHGRRFAPPKAAVSSAANGAASASARLSDR